MWFWDHLTSFVLVHGGNCLYVFYASVMAGPGRCLFIQSIIAVKLSNNVEPQTLENRRNWLVFWVHSGVG